MAQILIRNLPDEVVAGLKERAKRNRRSVQAEARLILEETVGRAAAMERLREVSERMTKELAGRAQSDSTEIIRQMREGCDHDE